MSKDLRFPIGEFTFAGPLSPEERIRKIDVIARTPAELRQAVKGLSDAQLDTPYRDGGWTVRQVVHHVPESHLNAYVRLKLTLTEDTPTIKPYDEAAWSRTGDVALTPIEVSLALLENLHLRWDLLWRSLKPEDFARTLLHPEHHGRRNVDWLLAVYAWHGPHHVAHITTLRQSKGW